MARFRGKKLPPHWVYVPSRRQVRETLGSLAADVRGVHFDGTGRPGPPGFLLGYLKRRVVEGAWCFYLRFWGMPEATVGDYRDELTQAALGVIRQSIAECLAQPAAAVLKATQVLLRFAIGEDGVQPRCRVKLVDRHSFRAGSWWAESGRA